MAPTRFAFIKARWHSSIVDQALVGFREIVSEQETDVFEVPGAFEMPLLARDLARTGQYAAVVAAAFVVDGGIYRHDFVAQSVVSGLMQVGLETNIPVLSVSLSPHHYRDSDYHNAIFRDHFIIKGREAAEAAQIFSQLRSGLNYSSRCSALTCD